MFFMDFNQASRFFGILAWPTIRFHDQLLGAKSARIQSAVFTVGLFS
jgi:hypothetical protein